MEFPVDHQGNQTMEFFPAPLKPDQPPFAVICVVWLRGEVLLANITNRGWCVPSGRLESNETPSQAAVRESREEGGVTIQNPTYIGSYKITRNNQITWAATFTAEVLSLEDFSPTEESNARMFCPIEKLPEIYYLWNPLTEAVFHHSQASLKHKN